MVAEAPIGSESTLVSALWYAGRGLQVFPVHAPTETAPCDCGRVDCSSPAKHPMTQHGLTDATTDAETIRGWWRQWPNANVAIRTGLESGVVVVDVDPGKDGYTTLRTLFTRHGAFPATRECATGGGGSHFYFRHPGIAVQSGNGVLGSGVDLKADGGYVVAPPSRHASGRRYEWVHPEEDPTSAPLPPWILEERSVHEGSSNGNGIKQKLDLGSVLGGVSEGQRDSSLFRAASKLRYAGVPQEWAERFILDAAMKCVPPFPERDARAKVASAYGRYDPTLADIDDAGDAIQALGRDAVRVVTSCPMGPVELVFSSMEKVGRELDTELTIRLMLPGTTGESYRQRINILSSSARESLRRELDAIYGKDAGWGKLLPLSFAKAQDTFLLQDRAVHTPDIAVSEGGIEHLIEEFMPADGPTIVFGAGASAKTYLVYQMVIALANGITFLGRTTERRRVLMVDYETGEQTYGIRMRRIIDGIGRPEVSTNGVYYWDAGGVPLHDQVDAIRRAVDRHGIGAIALDHVGAACGTEPEKAEAALRMQRDLARIGLPALLIAHITGDGQRDPSQVQRPFGSIFWLNMCRQAWFVQRAPTGDDPDKAELGFIPKKQNDSAAPPPFGVNVFFGPSGGPVKIVPADIRRTPSLNEARGTQWRIWNVINEAGEPLPVKEIAKALGIKEGSVKRELNAHKTMFRNVGNDAGRGRGEWTINTSIVPISPPTGPSWGDPQ